MTLAGVPIAIQTPGISLFTKESAPIMAYFPIVTLCKIVAPSPIQAPSFIKIIYK